ncbi:choice-of-anchor A family protein [Stakelama tenebrarum]|uniref:Choice-of-anchor A family protein n=1 Tax=Stakelama tenebrarum TaxID=2711215 RepID=A0A6G6Y6T6_9SPHN|nr:choice-of-anchor A family protein [Sphingosinithalassobacter tenebrarum]QIG80635.1 choice-of-anchor A family protein [Sphingosinithalassobacter tenebrarum]
MSRSKLLLAASLGAAALAMPQTASAQVVTGLDALRNWNLMVLGDLTSSSEVEGRTYVTGNLNGNSSNYQIRTPSDATVSGLPGLTVVGDVTGGAKNLNNGSGAVIGGNVDSGFNLNGAPQTVKVGGTISNTNVNSNTVNSGLAASDPAFMSDLQLQASVLDSSLHDLSHDLAGLDANSTATFSGNRGTFDATPGADGVAVFSIDAADLDSIGEIQFNTNGADTVVVNVAGADINLNDNFLGGTSGLGENVIWNFSEAETLDLSTAWGGSVLAPDADAHTRNYVEGSAVFGNLVQDGEFHLGTYAGGYNPPSNPGGGGDPTPVPEPGTMLLFLIGAGGLFYVARRQRKTAAA